MVGIFFFGFWLLRFPQKKIRPYPGARPRATSGHPRCVSINVHSQILETGPFSDSGNYPPPPHVVTREIFILREADVLYLVSRI